MSSHHNSNMGSFGSALVCDLDGYTYTTAAEWLTVANLDGQTRADLAADPEYAREWSEQQAAAAVAALDAAEAAVAAWRS